MPLIQPRTKQVAAGRFIAPIWVENLELLHKYAAFIGESPAYVVNELIATTLEKDKEFQDWKKEHQQTYYTPAPRASKAVNKSRPTALRTAV